MARFSKASWERGTANAKPPQLSIVIFRFVSSRRRWHSLARKFMGAAGIPAKEAARALAFRPKRRRLLARTAQTVPDSSRRDLPEQRHRRIKPCARAARGV